MGQLLHVKRQLFQHDRVAENGALLRHIVRGHRRQAVARAPAVRRGRARRSWPPLRCRSMRRCCVPVTPPPRRRADERPRRSTPEGLQRASTGRARTQKEESSSATQRRPRARTRGEGRPERTRAREKRTGARTGRADERASATGKRTRTADGANPRRAVAPHLEEPSEQAQPPNGRTEAGAAAGQQAEKRARAGSAHECDGAHGGGQAVRTTARPESSRYGADLDTNPTPRRSSGRGGRRRSGAGFWVGARPQGARERGGHARGRRAAYERSRRARRAATALRQEGRAHWPGGG